MHRFSILLILTILVSAVISAAPKTFCKCTCFTNSTIIALGPKPLSSSAQNLFLKARAPASASCSQCNRAFCLSNHLPICKGAEEKDVFTTCFQRDSTKDQVIVFLFIGATAGLLVWAGVKKVMEKRAIGAGSQQPAGQYTPVTGR